MYIFNASSLLRTSHQTVPLYEHYCSCFVVQSTQQHHYLMGHLHFPTPVPGFERFLRRQHLAVVNRRPHMSLVMMFVQSVRLCLLVRSIQQGLSLHGQYLTRHIGFARPAPGCVVRCGRRRYQAGKFVQSVNLQSAGPVVVCCNE